MSDPSRGDRLAAVLRDLTTESEALDALVSTLDEPEWRRPTPAAGWDVATTIAHVAWTDAVAVLAATDREGWNRVVEEAVAAPTGFVDSRALAGGSVPPQELLARWRAARARLAEALAEHPLSRGCPGSVPRRVRSRWAPLGTWRAGRTGWMSPMRSECRSCRTTACGTSSTSVSVPAGSPSSTAVCGRPSRRCASSSPHRAARAGPHGGNGLASEYGLGNMLVAARLGRIAPVSREMILNFVAMHSLGLPKSY